MDALFSGVHENFSKVYTPWHSLPMCISYIHVHTLNISDLIHTKGALLCKIEKSYTCLNWFWNFKHISVLWGIKNSTSVQYCSMRKTKNWWELMLHCSFEFLVFMLPVQSYFICVLDIYIFKWCLLSHFYKHEASVHWRCAWVSN